jgi:hypothetical protein
MMTAFRLSFVICMLFPDPNQDAVPEIVPGQETSLTGQEEHWTPLFNGKELTSWYTFLEKHGKNHDPERLSSFPGEIGVLGNVAGLGSCSH